jgi:hypothetical protein
MSIAASLELDILGFPEGNKMEKDTAGYIFRYFDDWMTAQEKLARKHLFATDKATHGRTDAEAQNEARSSSNPVISFLSNDPEVLRLASGGLDAFIERTAHRIFDEHSSEIVFNNCPRCGALAKTPKAQQCRFCRHDWHPIVAPTANTSTS